MGLLHGLYSLITLLTPRKLYSYKTVYWVAVKEHKLSVYIGETRLISIDTHYGNPKPETPKPYIPL